MSRQITSSSGGGPSTQTYIIIGAIVLGVLGLGFITWLNVRGPAPIEGVQIFTRQDRGHVDDLVYSLEDYDAPPPGGQHNSVWQDCNIYDAPVAIENVIHSLEHGAAWVAYNPDMVSAAEVEGLEDIVRGESFVILSPYPGLRSAVVMTAWQVQLDVDSATDPRIERFVERYQISEYTPERGATCANGNNSSMPDPAQ